MIDETLRRLEQRIRASERTSPEAKRDLLALVDELRAELGALAATHGDDAAEIARHAEAAAEGPVGAVEDSVLEFEQAHPRIVGLLRSFLQTLSDAGI